MNIKLMSVMNDKQTALDFQKIFSPSIKIYKNDMGLRILRKDIIF